MDQLCITAPGPTPLACATPLSFVPQSCMLTQEQGLHQLTSAVCPHVPTTPADRSQRPFTAPGSGRRYGSPGGYAGADVGAAVDVGEATLLDNMTTRTGGRAAGQRWGSGGAVVGERWGSGGGAVGQWWGSGGVAVGERRGSGGAEAGEWWESGGGAVGRGGRAVGRNTSVSGA